MPVNRCVKFLSVLASVLLIFFCLSASADSPADPLPEFTENSPQAWINSSPLSVSDLRGKVIMLDVWTYGCWNCYRSIPWLLTLEQRFDKDEFQVVGIHTPEFEHEHQRDNVIAKMQEFKLTHPVMMDNTFSYWKALKNRYWPAFYIVDKQGNIRGRFIGETHAGSVRAKQMESLIKQLLQE